MGFERIGYAVVLTKDFAAAKEWYVNALGMEPAELDEDGKWAAFRFSGGGAALALHGGVPLPVMAVMPTVVPSIEVTDIEGTVAALKARGVDFIKEVHDVPGRIRTADFRDPEGNLIQVFEPVVRG